MTAARARPVCSHCSVPTRAAELSAEGLCRLCLEEEGPPPDADLEAAGVQACRASGIIAIARPCAWDKCNSCVSLRGRTSTAPPPERPKRARASHFTELDAECLRRYFSRALRAGIGVGASSLSGMASRQGENPNYKTTELPSRTEPRCPICAAKMRAPPKFRVSAAPAAVTSADLLAALMDAPPIITTAEQAAEIEYTPPSEDAIRTAAAPLTPSHNHSRADREALKPIRVYDKELPSGQLVQVQVMPPSLEPHTYESHFIQCKGNSGGGKFGSWDDEAVDYVQGRSSETQINRVLAHMSALHQDVLENYYASNEEWRDVDSRLGEMAAVALMTTALRKAHEQASLAGKAGTYRDTLEALKLRANETTTGREAAARKLEAMRTEAEEMVNEAQVAYAWAATVYG